MTARNILMLSCIFMVVCGDVHSAPAWTPSTGSLEIGRTGCGPEVLLAQAVGAAKPKKPSEESRGGDDWRLVDQSVVYSSNPPTPVTIAGNVVLVPVTLSHRGNETEVRLMLDTGSSRTVISAEVADRLHIDLATAKRARVQVVGGAVIEARRVTLARITLGPHTRKNLEVLVIPHNGPPVDYDGLLGMDVLRQLKYRLDIEKKVVVWD